MAAPVFTTESGLLFHAGKILVATVGLPARGKTHISRSLERYLRWLGVKTQVISLGDYRRKKVGGAQQLPKDYFALGERSPGTVQLRQSVAEGCEQQIWQFFERGGQVVIYDANNGTRAARKALAEKFDKAGIHVIFLGNICDNKEIVEANIRSVKISSPDYKGWDPEKAVKDYFQRIHDHEKYYDPVEETDWPSIRITNVGDKIEVNRIQGYLQSRIIFFLMNIHNRFRTIYFARSGQSLIEHSYKADSDLSPAGWEYAARLKDFLLERRAKALRERGMDPADRKLVIWTSARRRAHHTAWPFLSPIGSGSIPTSLSSSSSFGASAPVSSASSPLLGALNPAHQTASSQNLSSLVSVQSLSQIPSLQLPESVASTPSPTPRQAVQAHQKREVQSQVQAAAKTLLQQQQPQQRLFKSVKVIEKPQMSEINPGVWDGLSPDKAQALDPEEWERFMKDPYGFRAPRAESYHDLCVRLEPILVELEREQEDLLIIGHASVIRCLLAYLIGLPASEIPAIEVARGDLLEIVPASYGVHSTAYHFWDGPGRRGSASGGTKRAGSAGGRGKPRTNSGSSLREGLTIKEKERDKSHSRVRELRDAVSQMELAGATDDYDHGAGGGAGVYGNAVFDGEDQDEQDEDEDKNFYENYAEDTKGKRKLELEHSALI